MVYKPSSCQFAHFKYTQAPPYLKPMVFCREPPYDLTLVSVTVSCGSETSMWEDWTSYCSLPLIYFG